MPELNALIPMGIKPADWGNALSQGVQTGNALLDAPVKRKLMEAQANYYNSPDARASVYGTPIPYRKPDGSIGLGAIGKNGQFVDINTPGEYLPGTTMVDQGDRTTPVSKATGAPIAPSLPKVGNPSSNFIPGQNGQPGHYQPGSVEDVEANKPAKARNQVDAALDDLESYYDDLDKGGGLVDPSRSTLENIQARAGSSGIGQLIGSFVGTQNQTTRDKISTLRPALINSIRQATGMSAKAMDSNAELQFYLQQATDPSLGKQANYAAMKALRRAYGAESAPAPSGAPAARPVQTMNVSPNGTMTPTQPYRAPEPKSIPSNLNQQQVETWVQEAVQAGVPEDAIRARLKEMGIDLTQ